MCALGQDLLVPAYKSPGSVSYSYLMGAAPYKRDILLFLRGDVGLWRAPCYSRGIRQKLML